MEIFDDFQFKAYCSFDHFNKPKCKNELNVRKLRATRRVALKIFRYGRYGLQNFGILFVDLVIIMGFQRFFGL